MCNVENKINDEEILKFLKFSYFGDLNISIEVASNRAYRDMCRTLKFNILPKDTKATTISGLKEAVNVIFKEEIPIINESNITSSEEFNSWHCKVCGNIKNLYKENDIKFTYGQAQKWLNMTIKYLYLFGGYTFDSVFEYLHIPIDNYIFNAVKDELKINRPKNISWSKLDKKEYLKYQEDIREELRKKNSSPLRWEFENWLNEAEKRHKKLRTKLL